LGPNIDKAVTIALSDSARDEQNNFSSLSTPNSQELEVSLLSKWKKRDKITFYSTICIAEVLILLFFILMIFSRNQIQDSSNLNDTDLIINYIWSRNVPYFNETDNICYRSIAMIREKYEPYSHSGYNLDSSCDNGYSLGEKDFIYTCILDGKVHIVFSKAQKNGSFIVIDFTWEQFCTLMFLSNRLSDDITHLMYSV